ncbi:cell division protein FtsL [Ornithinibacillus halophilus]|uniref:Cell division protein FtsL n=1 Tax=Ornithinibacillus halophilus TaxID=930117 RepID=A0A1M5C3L6_9BACI|nr:cell division protein FtsL [Ornithinibacillus halophilus]SHF49364.1 cell division protein FtsL [Ornithinibacillus halophilus]
MAANHARTWQETYSTNTQTKPKKVVVHKKSWITKGEKVIYSLIGICLIVAIGYIVSFSSSTDALNRDLQNLQQEVEVQSVKNEGLVFQIKDLSRPERITKIAEENGLKIQDTEVRQANAYKH